MVSLTNRLSLISPLNSNDRSVPLKRVFLLAGRLFPAEELSFEIEVVFSAKDNLLDDFAFRHRTVHEFIDPVFTKTSPKRSFSLNRKRAFWLVFAKTGSIISGTVIETTLP